MNNPIHLLTFVAALGSGLVAGIFFAFSNFVGRGREKQNAAELASAVRYPQTFRAMEVSRGRGERTKFGSAGGGT
jgi:hypothetical protein